MTDSGREDFAASRPQEEGKAEPRPGGLRSIEQAAREAEERGFYAGFSKGWDAVYEHLKPPHDNLKWVRKVIGVDIRWKEHLAAQAPTAQSAPPPAGYRCPSCRFPSARRPGQPCETADCNYVEPEPPPVEPPAPRPMDCPPKGEQKPGVLYLYDRADGVKGHFCIGRLQENGVYHEYWSESILGFTAFGTLYTTRAKASAKLAKLEKLFPSPAPEAQAGEAP